MVVSQTVTVVKDLSFDYPFLLRTVMREGEIVAPRGQLIREVRPLVLVLEDASKCVVRRPGFSKAVMWAEIAMVLGGEYCGPLYDAVAPKATRALLTEFGAYGPRTWEQLRTVADELAKDPDSRRAVVYVGRPSDLSNIHGGETDMPCTMTWQFFIRDHQLEMIVNMRSWDLVWGLSYDVPVFTSVQRLVAAAVGVPTGRYTHIAGSGHIYEKHWALGDELDEDEPGPPIVSVAPDFSEADLSPSRRVAEQQNEAMTALRAVVSKDRDSVPPLWLPAFDAWRPKLG